MNYLEDINLWESSEDKNQSTLLVFLFFIYKQQMHTHTRLDPTAEAAERGSSTAEILSLFLHQRKLSRAHPPQLVTLPLFSYLYFYSQTPPNINRLILKHSLGTQKTSQGTRSYNCYFLMFRMQNLPTLMQSIQGKDRRVQDDRWIWTEPSFILQIDLANTVAYERSALPQRQPFPSTGMESDMTNIDFP